MNEHEGWICNSCGSDFIRFEHLDGKDCDKNCADPCLIRICNEEYCTGEAKLGLEQVVVEISNGDYKVTKKPENIRVFFIEND